MYLAQSVMMCIVKYHEIFLLLFDMSIGIFCMYIPKQSVMMWEGFQKAWFFLKGHLKWLSWLLRIDFKIGISWSFWLAPVWIYIQYPLGYVLLMQTAVVAWSTQVSTQIFIVHHHCFRVKKNCIPTKNDGAAQMLSHYCKLTTQLANHFKYR